MKRFVLFLLLFQFSLVLFSQNLPVANDDFYDVSLGELVTVNVTANDTHEDNLYFYVFLAPDAVSFTDSTITYNIDYELYYNVNDTLEFAYTIKDENGQLGYESIARVHLVIKNNKYYDFLDHNNIRARIQASGLQFWPGPNESGSSSETGEFEFPKGSGKTTIFNSVLWVGGLDESNQLHLAAERYRQLGIDYWPGPLSNNSGELSIDTSTVLAYQNVWKLSKEEVIHHKLHWWEDGYEPIQNIESWPAHGDLDLYQSKYLAPFVDVDGDSIYNPMQGDYPLIRGDQCIYFIINDLRNHGESQGEILGLEIHGMAYQFNSLEVEPMNNTVFFSYKIFNRSNFSYHDAYIGLFTDFDIGYAWDDYVGCDVSRGAYFGYNGDEVDGNGEPDAYGDNPPAQGMIILGGPLMDANGVDDPDGECDESINGVGFGDEVVDNERYGMRKFLWFNNSGGGHDSDPSTADEYYSYLKSVWLDGTAMEYGGNGHVSSGAYGPAADFMFPGLSDPCFWGTAGEEPFGPIEWTEITAENIPGDRRGLSVMGPFTFEATSMERIDIAYVATFAEGDKSAIETLMDYVDIVKEEYHKDPTHFGYQWLGTEEIDDETNKTEIIAFPNPVSSDLSFVYTGNDMVATYRLTDLMGKLIFSADISKDEINKIDLSSLKSGLYILSVSDSKTSYSSKILKH